jgi:hypothetical protein
VDTRTDSLTDEVEQPAGPVTVGVLVEHALARTAAEFLRLCGVVDQLAVHSNRLRGVLDDEQLAPGLEPPLDPLVRVGHDRRPARGELERPGR